MQSLEYGPSPRIAILISGRGSNMQAILARRAHLGGEVVGVISSRASAPGLSIATASGVETAVIAGSEYKGRRADYDAALATVLDGWKVDLVILAGFMRILSDAFVAQYPWRIVNIHPSLLPVFPGLDPHGQAIQAGVKVSGCTVHFVAVGAVDGGPIIAQTTVPVLANDGVDQLAARVLEAEHQLFPTVIAGLARGEYFRSGARVHAKQVGDRV